MHTPSPSSSSRASGGGGGADPAELTRLQRRVEQLQSEIRMLRGGGDKALKMEEMENQLAELKRKNSELEGQVVGAKKQLADEAGDAKVQRASYVLSQADEVVNGLNDLVSELRINVMAAEGSRAMVGKHPAGELRAGERVAAYVSRPPRGGQGADEAAPRDQ